MREPGYSLQRIGTVVFFLKNKLKAMIGYEQYAGDQQNVWPDRKNTQKASTKNPQVHSRRPLAGYRRDSEETPGS